ncbi:MAG: hypothetical protein ACI8ZX_000493 [Planctomycetota bacterium]
MGNGEKTNKMYLEELWLIPILDNLKTYLNKDERKEELKQINKMKKY